jgi:TonB family protein
MIVVRPRASTMNRLFLTSSFWLYLAMASSVLAFQGGKRDPTPTSLPSTTSPSTKIPRRRIPVVRRTVPSSAKNDESKNAKLAIKVTPADSVVWLNDQQMSNLSSDGNLAVTNLKPGPYVLTVRHAGYSDLVRHIDLKPDENDPINIALEPIKGTLSVKPNVDGSSIGLRSIDRDASAGEYAGAIDQIEFPPGEYEVTISKPGYRPTSRRFTLKPGATVELEPRLDALPTPTPTPQVVIASRSSVTIDGKYLVIRVVGTSGDSARTNGAINVTVNRGVPTAYVQGSLNGLPCNISFLSGENLAEGSLIESPNPSNGWALIGARIRPKDSKRPMSFTVNWSAIQNSNDPTHESPGKAATSTDVMTKAVPIHRVVPKVPLLARSSRTKGVVKVTVLVDEEGNVKSAKAFDGPMALRRAAEDAARDWKFKPATRNGIPTQSTEIIYFSFEGY